MEELKKEVSNHINILFGWMDGSEIEDVKDSILNEVCKDVMETSDYPSHNDSDIRIAIKRVLINKLKR